MSIIFRFWGKYLFPSIPWDDRTNSKTYEFMQKRTLRHTPPWGIGILGSIKEWGKCDPEIHYSNPQNTEFLLFTLWALLRKIILDLVSPLPIMRGWGLTLRIKRPQNRVSPGDGRRVSVDWLWQRGIKNEKTKNFNISQGFVIKNLAMHHGLCSLRFLIGSLWENPQGCGKSR